jgi:hypothetical protein
MKGGEQDMYVVILNRVGESKNFSKYEAQLPYMGTLYLPLTEKQPTIVLVEKEAPDVLPGDTRS